MVEREPGDRRLAQSFGSVVDDYVRGRPGWPLEAIDVLGLPRTARVLDLAAGTGKLTDALAARFDDIVAVEPDDAMRGAIRSGEVLAGSAETIPLPHASVDGIFVGEAFHWFCDPPALREIERVLRPGGTLALLWNRQLDPLEELWQVHELMQRLRDEVGVNAKTHRFFSGEFKRVFERSRFEPLREAFFEHDHVLDRDGLVAYLMSQSQVAYRPEPERAAIRRELERLVSAGRHVRPLRCEVYWTRLRADG